MDVVGKQVVVIEPEAHSVKDSEQMETSQEGQAQVPEQQQQQQQKPSEKESSKGPTMNSLQLPAGPNKALADLFEALTGAAYLDSGGSIAAIEKIVTHIRLLPQLC
eukprot:gene27254-35992_t